jgi:TRAP-type C4-dicarboxylate transport system permease small subunit
MKLFGWLDSALVVVAALALIVMMLLVTASVVGRYFFSAPIPDDLVMSEILMLFVAFLPLSYVQARREHVFVTVFTDWMSTNAKAVLDVFGILVGMCIFTVVAWAVTSLFIQSWGSGAYNYGPLRIPEWPGRFIVALGLSLLALRLVIDFITSIIGLATGRAMVGRSEVEVALEKEV